MKNDRYQSRIETPEEVRIIVSAYAHIEKELEKEYIRDKQRYLEKWGLRSFKTNTPRTALESW
jgi:hypothetical protein